MASTTRPPTSYDEVPYISLPFRESHPANFAVLAQLFGMTPKPIEQSRVLELGCAAGGNLAPMADAFDRASFVGIDSSEKEIADGQEFIGELGLANLELKRASITDVDESWGMFDYIIAHGVYSWVPQDVREHLLKICRQNLSPQGVAYISYNTYPGWHSRGVIRDLMCFAGQKFDAPRARLAAGRGALELMARILTNSKDPYGQLLHREAELVRKSFDYYLFHDHLSQHNDPVYFHEFAAAAQKHGMQYLSEANPAVLSMHNAQVDQIIRSMSSDVIEIEQYMDFVRNRAFRQTLLCHADVTLQRTSGPAKLAGLYLASPSKPLMQPIDFAPGVPAQFRHEKGMTMSITSSLAKAAMLELSQMWPASVKFEELVERAVRHVGAPTENAAHTLGRDLLRIYAGGGLEMALTESRFTKTISSHPTASRLARLQVTRGDQELPGKSAHDVSTRQEPRLPDRSRVVTNRRHDQVQLNAEAARLLAGLDGTRDLPTLARELAASESVISESIQAISTGALLIA